MQEVRLIDANALKDRIDSAFTTYGECTYVKGIIDAQPTVEAEPVLRGHWIECDYKHLEHGFMETEPNAGMCCSNCRTAFQKKKMTYKQYCAACGAKMQSRMDGGADNG